MNIFTYFLSTYWSVAYILSLVSGEYLEIWILDMNWDYGTRIDCKVEMIMVQDFRHMIIVILVLLWHVSYPCECY